MATTARPTPDLSFVRPGRLAIYVGLAVVLGLSGCNREARVPPPPKFEPEKMTEQVMSQCDTNKDGYLDAKELTASPGLKSALKKLDADHDNRLSAAEISGLLQRYKDSGTSLTGTNCTVLFNGQPLAGATVTLEPEPFLAAVLKPAKGQTNEQGVATPQVEGMELPGCQSGVYRVQVSKKDDSGKELLPPRYNTATVLGLEVGTPVRGADDSTTFRLTGN